MVDETFFQQCHLNVDAVNKVNTTLFQQRIKMEYYVTGKTLSNATSINLVNIDIYLPSIYLAKRLDIVPV